MSFPKYGCVRDKELSWVSFEESAKLSPVERGRITEYHQKMKAYQAYQMVEVSTPCDEFRVEIGRLSMQMSSF